MYIEVYIDRDRLGAIRRLKNFSNDKKAKGGREGVVHDLFTDLEILRQKCKSTFDRFFLRAATV